MSVLSISKATGVGLSVIQSDRSFELQRMGYNYILFTSLPDGEKGLGFIGRIEFGREALQ